MAYQIGSNTFPVMTGNVVLPQAEIEIIEKRGEDGFIRRDLGLRYPAFQVSTLGAYQTHEEADEAFEAFLALKTDVPQDFEFGDIDYTTNGIGSPVSRFKAVVLEVEKTNLRNAAKTTIFTGATNHTWVLECNWTLRLTPHTP